MAPLAPLGPPLAPLGPSLAPLGPSLAPLGPSLEPPLDPLRGPHSRCINKPETEPPAFCPTGHSIAVDIGVRASLPGKRTYQLRAPIAIRL